MKKILSLMLMMVMVLSLAACGGEKQKPASQGDSNQEVTDDSGKKRRPGRRR